MEEDSRYEEVNNDDDNDVPLATLRLSFDLFECSDEGIPSEI